jgi:hypothetical protein
VSDAVGKAWRGRAHGEARVGRTFARLAAAFGPDELAPSLREALVRAAAEEQRHAALCVELAAQHGISPAPPEPDEPIPLATPEERAVLLVGACCVSESIASAYLEHCWKQAKGEAKSALHELLRDEIGHAQIGWAYLAGLPADSPIRAVIRSSAAGLIERTKAAWIARISTLHATPMPEEGYPPADELIAIVDEAAKQLVARGFAYVGL